MKTYSNKPYLILIISAFLYAGCQSDKTQDQSIDEINIRLSRDPLKINPIFNPSSSARQVFQYIFTPLADFHPDTKELIPILIENMPTKKVLEEGPFIGDDKYTIRFKDEAKWSDGSDITAEDFLFTYKAIMLPQSNTIAWRSYLDYIKDIKLDENDPKSFDIIVEGDYMLGKEAILTMYVLQRSVYDPEQKLSKLSFEDFEKETKWMEQDSQLITFADYFNSPLFSRDSVDNAGPYILDSWVTNQSIVLKRKDDYWAKDDLNPYLQAGSSKMIFKIIPDENTAITALKDNQLDVMTIKSSRKFLELSEDSTLSKQFDFYTPQQYSYYYIALNNRKPAFANKEIRKALAQALNVETIIETVDQGFGTRTIGHFNPSKSYYANDIRPYSYDISKAQSILDQEGWQDSNNNDIIDKEIDGKLVELDLDMIISGSELTENISILFKEELQKLGINLNITRKKYSIMRKEDIATRTFDMAAMAVTQDVAPDDPYARWHSDSDVPGGNNISGYRSEEADKLIESIREESDLSKRKDMYTQLQEQMHEDQPVIFLYCPKLKIVVNSSFSSSASSRRPGYMANTFFQKNTD